MDSKIKLDREDLSIITSIMEDFDDVREVTLIEEVTLVEEFVSTLFLEIDTEVYGRTGTFKIEIAGAG